MPPTLSYPGVYVTEIPSGVRTIAGVSTSITAFVGPALQGPVKSPTRIQSYGEFERIFGGLAISSPMSFAVRDYFLNGGSDAIIVRIVGSGAVIATAALLPASSLTLAAKYPGIWGNGLEAIVDHNTSNPANTALFNLTIRQVVNGIELARERFLELTTDAASPRHPTIVLATESQLAVVSSMTARPNAQTLALTGGTDGAALGDTEFIDGMNMLDRVDLFNMLCIPPKSLVIDTWNTYDTSNNIWSQALAYCKKRRAILIVDLPGNWDVMSEVTESTVSGLNLRDENAVTYFPRIVMPNPLRSNALEPFVACGAVAGVIARTDATRGVWKAPAGADAAFVGVQDFVIRLTDGDVGQLNPIGVNALRSLAAAGRVIWGARTLEGADRLASEWKYLPVRRTALYIEESLYRGTQWAVFEPNDESLWAQLRLNVGAFMNNLFRQGAFQGTSAREAYFVKCDRETTTQNDIDLGIVNILVGFAPLKPAEFVVLKLQQIAGKIDT